MSITTDHEATSSPEPPDADPLPPTQPCAVVWCQGHPYVLDATSGRPRWVGTDHRGRPQILTGADLQRKGWTYRRSG